MRGKIFGTLFALPFFGVGVWMVISLGMMFFDAYDMRGWAPVPARLHAAGYSTNSGDDSDTFEAYANYSYEYFGQPYQGSRVSLTSGSDNIGSYQQATGRRLETAMARGEPITVWVDPDDPATSIIDPSIRWGLVGFKSIFLFVFGGVGLGLLIAIWRAPKEKDANLPEYQAAPWLLNDKWQTPSIRSDSKLSMWVAWGFAAFWNLVSAPTPFIAWQEFQEGNHVALVALLFPLIGILIIAFAIRQTREWRRFGATPVVLDPFPGSIGGHVGGSIETNIPYRSSHRFVTTLTSVHSYVSGSGKNRSRNEKARWQDEVIAHAESTGTGTRLVFRFDVPGGLEPSDAQKKGDQYDLWRLNIHAELEGADLDRDFEIPVYATATESRNISDFNVVESGRIQDATYDEVVRKHVRVSNDGMSRKLEYPMGINFIGNFLGTVIGFAFAAAGWWLVTEEGQAIFGSIFGGIGALVGSAAFYMLFRSLDVSGDGAVITSTRRWLGIPVSTRRMRVADFYRFEVDKGTRQNVDRKHTISFKVSAIDRNANEILLGEGFRGKPAADAAIRFLSSELGLEEREPKSRFGLKSDLPLTRT